MPTYGPNPWPEDPLRAQGPGALGPPGRGRAWAEGGHGGGAVRWQTRSSLPSKTSGNRLCESRTEQARCKVQVIRGILHVSKVRERALRKPRGWAQRGALRLGHAPSVSKGRAEPSARQAYSVVCSRGAGQNAPPSLAGTTAERSRVRRLEKNSQPYPKPTLVCW